MFEFLKKRYTKRVSKKAPYSDSVVESDAPNVARIAMDAGIALAIVIAIGVMWPFTTVPAGHRGVITTFGKVESVRDEGLQIVWPWQHNTLISVRADSADIKGAEGGTRDLQPVFVNLTVRYQIIPSKVEEIFLNYSRSGDLDSYVQTAAQEAFKAVTARFSAEELISKRSEVSTGVVKALDDRVDKYGVNIVSIDMTNFEFSKTFMAAINEKVTEEQKKKAEENKLQRMIVEQQQAVEKAKADAQAQKAAADGEAYALKTVAEARATALRTENAALRESKDVLELRRIEVDKIKAERWSGALPTHIYGSAPVPFMNVK